MIDDCDHDREPQDASIADQTDVDVACCEQNRVHPSPARLLARLALDRAIGAKLKRQLRKPLAMAIVVQVPGADWVGPMALAANSVGTGAVETVARDGSKRLDHRPNLGNEEVATALRRGAHVVGVSQAPDAYLPSTLIALADARVVAAAPDGRMIKRIVSACVGKLRGSVPDDVATGLSFDEIVGCFREGASPAKVVALIAAASAAKRVAPSDDPAPALADLPGFRGEARDWGMALAEDMAAWRRGEVVWRDVPASAVLIGPPGVGKTLFAKSLAAACGVAIVELSMGALFAQGDGHLNTVCRGISEAFASAKAAPSLLFVDEMEAIPDRATLSERNRDYWLPMINLMLTLSAEVVPGLIKLGASNFADRLDAALVRPGRFDRLIEVPPPGSDGIAEILAFHLGGPPGGADLAALTALARLRPGATGADAASWARAAKRIARGAGRDVRLEDVVAVLAPPDGKTDRDRRVAALHEAGHAVAVVLNGRALVSVSIAGMGVSGGHTTAKSNLSCSVTRAEVEAEARVLLAGRAVEIVCLGEASMGAEDDLRQATRLVAMLHTAGGLGADLLHRAPSVEPTAPLAYDPALRRAVADDLARIQARVTEDIRRHMDAVDALAEALIARRFLDGPEAEEIVRKALAHGARRGGTKPRRTP